MNRPPCHRLLPRRRLPPYSYVPGMFPHPQSDPQGHQFGEPPPKTQTVTSLLGHAELRWGLDLFNEGYYWESHECWESIWEALGRRGTSADFCKGLIKLAAACVKAREGNLEGVTRHLARAQQLLMGVALESAELGSAAAAALAFAQGLSTKPDSLLDTSPNPVIRIVDCLELPGVTPPSHPSG